VLFAPERTDTAQKELKKLYSMEPAFSNEIRIFNKKDIETHITKTYRGLK